MIKRIFYLLLVAVFVGATVGAVIGSDMARTQSENVTR